MNNLFFTIHFNKTAPIRRRRKHFSVMRGRGHIFLPHSDSCGSLQNCQPPLHFKVVTQLHGDGTRSIATIAQIATETSCAVHLYTCTTCGGVKDSLCIRTNHSYLHQACRVCSTLGSLCTLRTSSLSTTSVNNHFFREVERKGGSD